MSGLPNPWVILGVMVAVIAIATGAYFKGRHDNEAAHIAAALKAEMQIVADVQAQNKVTEAIAEKAEEKQVEIREVTKTVIKWRTKLVTQKADAACVVPAGFVRMHDASARGEAVSDPAGQSNDAPSGVALSEVGEAVAVNYGTYREVAQRLTDLQDWVRQQQKLWEARQ